jgi:hypothetical protein
MRRRYAGADRRVSFCILGHPAGSSDSVDSEGKPEVSPLGHTQRQFAGGEALRVFFCESEGGRGASGF